MLLPKRPRILSEAFNLRGDSIFFPTSVDRVCTNQVSRPSSLTFLGQDAVHFGINILISYSVHLFLRDF